MNNIENFVVFDIETTGFDPMKEQIIEIGAVKIDSKGTVIERFSKFISLYRHQSVPAEIVKLTNITDDILKEEGEEVKKVIEEFLDFSEGSILVAQNAKFDMSFLTAYTLFAKKEINGRMFVDTINLAKVIYPGKSSYSLKNLVTYFEIEYDADAHHRADYDAEITANLFVKQLEMLEFGSEIAIEELLKKEAALAPSEKQLSFLSSLIEQKNITENQMYFTKQTISTHIDMLMKMPNA